MIIDIIDIIDVVGVEREIKKRLRIEVALRSQPDSNWCERFCRPVPNHSDMRPLALVSRLRVQS